MRRTMKLPDPAPGLMWEKFWFVDGSSPPDGDGFLDADGWWWMQIKPYETGGSVIDLSEYTELFEGGTR